MVVRHFIAGLIAAACSVAASAQINQVTRLPQVGAPEKQADYTSAGSGFWMAAEASAAYSCRLFNSNFGYTEIDAVAGYRFNEYVRVGLGLGARYYFDNNKVRSTLSEWAFPIFLNVRGNFIPTRYRDVVPYYSFDIGVTVRDGFMLRPTVGLRVGRERSAFLVGLGYVGQDLSTYSRDNLRKTRRFVNFITLKLGYEF
jgi:hypothetical protein